MRTALLLGLFFLGATLAYLLTTSERSRPPELVLGSFEDDYQGAYVITPEVWEHGGSRYLVTQWDARERFVIARNSEGNSGQAGLWSRIDWMVLDDMEPWEWAFCFTAFDAPSPEVALAAAPRDRSSARTGCNGFPFSRMKRR